MGELEEGRDTGERFAGIAPPSPAKAVTTGTVASRSNTWNTTGDTSQNVQSSGGRQRTGHELQAFDVFGGPVHFTLHELLGYFLSRVGLLFLFLSLVAFFATDPPGLLAHMHWARAALIWPVAAFLYISFYLGCLALVARVPPLVRGVRIFLPAVGLCALVPTVAISEHLAAALSGGSYLPDVQDRIVFFFIAVQVFETVFIRFVLPGLQAQRAGGPAAAARPRRITAGDKTLALDTILHISAQEHNVRITRDDGPLLCRARLGDLIAQTGPGDGLQPHRSWWVSRRAAPDLRRKGGKPVLVLNDGTEVPVARARIAEVEAWLLRAETAGARSAG